MKRRTAMIAAMGIAVACGGTTGFEEGKNQIDSRGMACFQTNAFYTLGGTISGLAGTVVVQNGGTDSLSASADGSFTFATVVADGSTYEVTVRTQPEGQTCTVSNGTGIVAGANVTGVSVACAASPPGTLQFGYCIFDSITGQLSGECENVGECFSGMSADCAGAPNAPVVQAFCGPLVDNTFCAFYY